jgi:hypothetical protein
MQAKSEAWQKVAGTNARRLSCEKNSTGKRITAAAFDVTS